MCSVALDCCGFKKLNNEPLGVRTRRGLLIQTVVGRRTNGGWFVWVVFGSVQMGPGVFVALLGHNSKENTKSPNDTSIIPIINLCVRMSQ